MRGEAGSFSEAEGVSVTRTGVADLFKTEYEAMYRLAYTMLGNDGDAEEVVQEAFVGVAARWGGLDNPGGYLRVSVVNGARKQMRSRSRGDNATVALRCRAVLDAPAPEVYLLDVVDDLPERQRVALVLTYYSGLSSHEVAEVMECSSATARSLVRHALGHLRKVVER